MKAVTNNLATGRSQTYTYDEMNRLATAQSQATSGNDCWGQSYAYDRYANMPTIAVTKCTAPILNLSINNANNRILNSGFSYDAAGNVLTDGSATYIWNAEGRMSGVTPNGQPGVGYLYDGDGRRVAKTTGKLYWYGLGGEVLAEGDAAGNITYEYIYFGGKRIARRTPAGTVHYYLADRLGTARMLTNASGTVVEESDFLPYGTERTPMITNDPNVPDNTYKFTGFERDFESGLDHTEIRQYASTTGRWLSPDPVRGKPAYPQSWNRYTYVIGNPLNLIDPKGAAWFCVAWGDETGLCISGEDDDPLSPCYLLSCTIPPPPPSPYAIFRPFIGLTELGVGLLGNGQFQLLLPADFVNHLIGLPGVAQIPGLAQALRFCATNAPCLITLGVVTIAQLAILLHQAQQANVRANKQFKDALDSYERRCGRPLDEGDRRRVHDAITGEDSSFQDIIDAAVSIFGCQDEESGSGK